MIGAHRSRPLPMRRGLLFLLAALFVVTLPFVGTAGSVAAAELQPLEIASKGGVHVFAVEMASTPAEQAKGLMFRRELPEGQGMLFDFHHEQPTSFWMKNTYIQIGRAHVSTPVTNRHLVC